MSWMIVRSPYSGREVKVRTQDVGRSVRDGDGQIFYLLHRANGKGYFGSLTRVGGPDQEAAYDRILAQENAAQSTAEEIHAEQVHDATGRRRGLSGKLFVIGLLLVLGAGYWAIKWGPLSGVTWRKPPALPAPAQPVPGTPGVPQTPK